MGQQLDSITSSDAAGSGGATVIHMRHITRDTYVVHKLFADGSNFWRQGGRKHHDLLVMGCHFENVLHICAHLCD